MPERWEPKERKSYPFELDEKGIDLEERTFEGFAAVMGNFDGKDIIERGAFKRTIEAQGDRVKTFWIHNFQEPIGKPLELKEVPRGKLPKKVLDRALDATGGLFVKAQVDEIPLGDRALIQMKSGTLDELSIGFDAVKVEYQEHEELGGKSVRHIKELRLYDISPVPLGMNPAAIITDVKSDEDEKVEQTDDFIHVPAPGEEGKHEGDDHRKRTITLSEKEGIQALYCGSCKKNIKYIFAKEKTWTVAKAVAWVKEHHEKASDKAIFLLDLERADLGARIQAAEIQRQQIEAEL